MTADFAQQWSLDPDVLHLNHGSFGACPLPVQEAQTRYRRQLERNPTAYVLYQWEEQFELARRSCARFVCALPSNLVFVPNATTGINSVLRSLDLRSGDEILITDHEYNACRNAVDHVAARAGARVCVVALPFPLASVAPVLERILGAVTPRTRLALLDHVTSPTAIILPMDDLVRELSARGVDTLVDGAHGPGMLPLDLEGLGAAYYVGNCHKWLGAPKGAAFLHVREDKQPDLHPLAISHGFNAPRRDKSRFQLEFDWTGTGDPSPYLCVTDAIRFGDALLPRGWSAVRAHNHELALEGRRTLCDALCLEPPCPEEMLGSMAAIVLGRGESWAEAPPADDPLMHILYERHRIVVPVLRWPHPPLRILRISAHLYNDPEQYVRLAEALRAEL